MFYNRRKMYKKGCAVIAAKVSNMFDLSEILKINLRKIGIVLLSVLVFVMNLTGCANTSTTSTKGKDSSKSISLSELHFDTVMTITLYGSDETELSSIIEDAYTEVDRLETIFSAQLEYSELYDINERIAAGETTFILSDELTEVIKYALEINELSNGALDITIGNLIDLWGIGTDHEQLPDASEISEALSYTGCQYLSLNEDDNMLTVSSSNVKLDLGAIAKGYAADLIKSLILSEDSSVVGILDFGGNIMTIGKRVDGSKWKVGITDPLDTTSVYGGVSVSDYCVVTSGNYERYFEIDGVRYHHILDSYTGYPANKGIISSTIIGASSVECDALSTACYCLGIDDALKLINSIDGVECVLIDDEGNYHTSDGIAEFNFTKAN